MRFVTGNAVCLSCPVSLNEAFKSEAGSISQASLASMLVNDIAAATIIMISNKKREIRFAAKTFFSDLGDDPTKICKQED